ncbi:hypothetical protein CPB83DRAFT_900339 [Crepidotus variabilis]|uniref:Uncharacterized protein n=1 Tax=Crepidotus variabilis TaxID=179855 RepID=A0A9P6E3A5_9AGAR|nr:hypothetical protein CPB83DRAFT_900339 [Crepidotus variabilis]
MHDYNLETNFPLLPQSAFSLTVLFERSETSVPQMNMFSSALKDSSGTRSVPFLSGAEGAPPPLVLIPKPQGQAGALSRGGYSLRKVLKWDPKQYVSVQNYTRERIKHYVQKGELQPGRSITKQPSKIILTIQTEIATEFPFLLRYEDNWPTRDIMSRYLSKA